MASRWPFGLYELGEGGVAWTAELWADTVVLAGLLAGGIGLITQPPAFAAAATETAKRLPLPAGQASS